MYQKHARQFARQFAQDTQVDATDGISGATLQKAHQPAGDLLEKITQKNSDSAKWTIFLTG